MMLLGILFAVLAAIFTIIAEAMFKNPDVSIIEHGFMYQSSMK